MNLFLRGATLLLFSKATDASPGSLRLRKVLSDAVPTNHVVEDYAQTQRRLTDNEAEDDLEGVDVDDGTGLLVFDEQGGRQSQEEFEAAEEGLDDMDMDHSAGDEFEGLDDMDMDHSAGDHDSKMFRTLNCNLNSTFHLEDDAPCTPWSDSDFDLSQKVVIPCGTCVSTADLAGTLTLPYGLDIQGRLLMDNLDPLTVKTPFVTNQGVLSIPNMNTAITYPPRLEIAMTGIDDVFLHPHEENAHACDLVTGCDLSNRAIVVAGGRLDVTAWPSEGCKAWTRIRSVGSSVGASDSYDTLTVDDPGVAQCWGVGAELLIASETGSRTDSKVAIIQSVDLETGTFTFAESISPLLTSTLEGAGGGDNFAVEVALLSRNVVFRTEDEIDSGDGDLPGHMVVTHTSNEGHEQILEGVRIVNFGQTGTLGKYPMHFHMCGDSQGAVVRKNSITDSKQRCVVVHGSHNVTIEDNVAYNTMGHCYFLEDGNERDNSFVRNFASNTEPLPIEFQLRPEDSDHRPSSYWISNPQNRYVGNVAAGSAMFGFWIELRQHLIGNARENGLTMNPMKMELTLFDGNVAHSNQGDGFSSYEFSYSGNPDYQIRYSNLRSFRNMGIGAKFFHSHYMTIDGGVFSDNRWDLLIMRGNKIIVDSALIMGYSPEFRAVVAARGSVGTTKHCVMDGITIRWQLNDFSHSTMSGAMYKDVEFRHFEEALCASHAMELERVKGTHPSQLVLSGLVWGTGTSSSTSKTKFHLCTSNNEEIKDVFWEDADGSLNQVNQNVGGFVIHQVDDATPALVYGAMGNTCTTLSDSCALHCENACLRPVTIMVDSNASPDPDALVLEIAHSLSGTTVQYTGHQGSILVHENGQVVHKSSYYPDASRGRFFTIALPPGSYTAKFLHGSTSVYPSFIKEYWGAEPMSCSASYASPTLTYDSNDVPAANCEALVKGGNFEGADAETWWHTTGNARLGLVDSEREGSTKALKIMGRTSHQYGAAQWIDSRCLNAGSSYEFEALVKLLDSAGNPVSCTPGPLGWGAAGACPEFQLFGHNADGTSFHQFDVGYASESPAASDGGWARIHGFASFEEAVASAERVLVHINGGDAGLDLLVDEISIMQISSPTASPTRSPIGFDGNAIMGDGTATVYHNGSAPPGSEFIKYNGGSLTIGQETNGNKYFRHTGRTDYWWGLKSYVDTQNLAVGKYRFNIDYRMNNNDDNQWDYVLGQLSWLTGNVWDHKHFVWCPKTTGSVGWMNCQQIVEINDVQARSQIMEIKMAWREGWNLYDNDYDNVMFEEYNPVATDNLVLGDGSGNDGIAGFSAYNEGSVLINQEPGDGNNYFHNIHRTLSWHGMKTYVDTSRFVEGNTYKISWKYRTYSMTPDTMRTQLSWKESGGSWGHVDLYCPDPSSYAGAGPHTWQYCENTLMMDSGRASSVEMEMKLIWNGDEGGQTADADYDDLFWVCVDCEQSFS